MRWLILLIVLSVVLMFVGGWLQFRNSGDKSEVILDKNEVRQDTDEAVEKGKEVLKEAAAGIQKAGKSVEDHLSKKDDATEQVPAQEPAPSE